MDDTDDGDEAAEMRGYRRTATIEEILARVRVDLRRQSYPTTSDELASTYGSSTTALPDETESIGSAFGRLDERFEDPTAAFEALVREFEGGEFADAVSQVPASKRATWSEDAAADDGDDGD